MTPEAHCLRHIVLHEFFDELLGDWLWDRRDATPRSSIERSISELMRWSFEQTQISLKAKQQPLFVRLVAKRLGGHIHVAMFAGFNLDRLGKCGDFTLREEEWPAFRAMFPRSVLVEERGFAGEAPDA